MLWVASASPIALCLFKRSPAAEIPLPSGRKFEVEALCAISDDEEKGKHAWIDGTEKTLTKLKTTVLPLVEEFKEQQSLLAVVGTHLDRQPETAGAH
jgi:hypothetical protein